MGSKKRLLALVCLVFLLAGCSTVNAGNSNFAVTDSVAEVEETVAATPEPTETPEPTPAVEVDLDDPNVVEITEKMFLTQINDIYYNFDDYADKTIVVEGMYATFYSWDGVSSCAAVYRNGPGCCGNDGWGGFMLAYDGESPREDAWVRVIGTPEMVTTESGYTDLYLNVISIEVKLERGAEFVSQ